MNNAQPNTAAPTVLVIDDESAVREAIVDILELIDVTAVEAVNGLEGIARFKEYRESVKLIFLDMHMPLLDGQKTCQQLRELDATIPIIISSGVGKRQTLAKFDGCEYVSYLQKPYQISTLLDLVQEKLNPPTQDDT